MRAAAWLLAMASAAHAAPCDVEDVPARVARLTGRVVAPSGYTVTTAARDGAIAATVAIGGGEREVVGASCDAALDAAALVIGMAAPEVETQARDGEEPAASRRAVAEAIEVGPSPAPPMLIPPPVIATEGWSLSAGAGVAGSAQEATTIGASLRRGGHSFGLELRATASTEVVVTPAASASIREAAASGLVCSHVSVLAACALASAGFSYGTGDHLRDVHDGALPLLAFGARLAWEYPQGGRLAIRVAVEGTVRATRTHFDVDDMPVWTSRRFDGLASGAVVVRFP